MHSAIEIYEQYENYRDVNPLYTMVQYAVFSSALYTNQLRHKKFNPLNYSDIYADWYIYNF
jgi:hypothetical protein